MSGDRIITGREVCRRVGFSREYIWKLMREGLCPQPLRSMTGRKRSRWAWRESTIDGWIAAQK